MIQNRTTQAMLMAFVLLISLACGAIGAVPPTLTPAFTPTSAPTKAPVSPPQKPSPAPTLTSLVDSSLVSVTFTVVNKSGEPLDLSWVDWQQNRGGKEEKYATIPSGESYEQQTYFADGWLIRDRDGDIIILFFASEDDKRIITITPQVLAVAKQDKRTEVTLTSLSGMEDLPAANVRFVNKSSTELFVFLIDVDDNYETLGTLTAGDSLEAKGLVFGSMISVNDEAGNIVLLYVATEDKLQTVNLSDAAVAYRFGISQ